MKTILKLSVMAIGAALLSACSGDLLNTESRTAPTTDFLYTSPEGLQKAIVGLYDKDREIVTSSVDNEGAEMYSVIMLDYCTDLMLFRSGTAATFARLNNFKTSTNLFNSYWKLYYSIIGKANEIIAGARDQGLDDETVAQIYGEACCFRARAYFMLFQRYERLYLNVEPTSIDNAFGRTFRAAGRDEIFTQIKSDLSEAIKYLDWKLPSNGTMVEYGRLTQGVARHIRAQVAMWEEDWGEAAAQVDTIFANGTHRMAASAASVFNTGDYTDPEVLYAFQFSDKPGGGNSVSGGVTTGHRLSLIVTAGYKGISGFIESNEYGGYGWGRVYPNSYLLGLYDKSKDRRYTELFQHEWRYNDPQSDKYGQLFVPNATQYISNAHPCSVKHMDKWTHPDNPALRSSFKDVMVYRLAETALIGCEAYFHKEGGNSAKALEYYNKTWQRAGNNRFNGPLTLDLILDETARECHFEGVRWNQLKRLGLLGERVRAHAGDTVADDPKLPSDYAEARANFSDSRDWRWPIPQTQLDLMPGFGQNAGW